MVSVDFFTVPTIRFQVLYILEQELRTDSWSWRTTVGGFYIWA
jgi:hypothetical protein